MKKTLSLLLCLGLGLSLVGCGSKEKANTLESDFDDKKIISLVNKTVDELNKNEDIKKLKYKKGYPKKNKIEYISGDCIIALYVKSNDIDKIVLAYNDDKQNLENYNKILNYIFQLSCLDLENNTHIKIGEHINGNILGEKTYDGYDVNIRTMDNEYGNYSFTIENASKRDKKLNKETTRKEIEIAKKEQEEQLKKEQEESRIARERTFSAGKYIVGTDIDIGKYDIIASSGDGLLFISGGSYESNINEMMGVTDPGFYIPQYSNATLSIGQEIEITSSLVLMFKPK